MYGREWPGKLVIHDGVAIGVSIENLKKTTNKQTNKMKWAKKRALKI